MIELSLPWPPTVNAYYRRHQGRVLISREGRAYRERVAKEVVVQKVPRFRADARLALTIEAHPPDRRNRDLDNLNKALLDSLEHTGVFPDDAQIDDLRVRRMPVEKPGRIRVTIRSSEDAA